MAKVKEAALDGDQMVLAAEAPEEAESPSTALITIRQLPIIQQNLIAVKAKWEGMAAEAESMVATEESVQALKKMKAAINTEFDLLNDQRIATKKQYQAPWDAVEATFKECVKEPKDRAVASLTDTINDFESKIVAKTRKALEDHFRDLCALEQIDFLTFEKAMELAGIKKISLTDAKKRDPKALKDSIASAVARVATGRSQILQMEDSAEIMVEFKKNFDAMTAVAIVQQRKRQKAEAEAEIQRRKEEEARQAEAVARVQAAAPKPMEMPTEIEAPESEQPKAPQPNGTPLGKKMRFPFSILYFDTVEQYQAVLPILDSLKKTIKQEGIRYE